MASRRREAPMGTLASALQNAPHAAGLVIAGSVRREREHKPRSGLSREEEQNRGHLLDERLRRRRVHSDSRVCSEWHEFVRAPFAATLPSTSTLSATEISTSTFCDQAKQRDDSVLDGCNKYYLHKR